MSLTIYTNPLSSPGRAVVNFCTLNHIAFTQKVIDLFKGEQKQPEYTKINPLQMVPCIDDHGFILTESIAILKYLAQTHKVPSNWYPAQENLKTTAKLDEFLSWFPFTIRRNVVGLIFNKVLAEAGKLPKFGDPADFEKALGPVLKTFEEVFLTGKYIASNSISIADLMAFHELLNLLEVDFDFTPYPKIVAYFKLMLTHKEVKDEAFAFVQTVQGVLKGQYGHFQKEFPELFHK